MIWDSATKPLALLALLFFLAACAPAQEDTITIGAILPLTGPGAFWGTNSQKGIEFAVERINAQGGIDGVPLEVIFEDSKCEPKEGVAAMQKLLNIDKVPAVIGAVCSSVTSSVAPLAQEAGVVEITPCSEAPQISDMGDYIFRTWTPNNLQARIGARFAFEELGARKAAVLSINNDFGESLTQAFAEEFESLGGNVVTIQRYEQDQRDLRTELTKVKAETPDLVYMTSYPPDGVIAVQQMADLGIDAELLGTSGIHSKEEVFDKLGDLAEGIYLTDLEDSTTAQFREEYRERYGQQWPGIISCASVAYDDAMLLADAFRAVGTDAAKVKDYLAGIENFPGASGPITFDANGDLDRQHVVFEVADGDAQVHWRG